MPPAASGGKPDAKCQIPEIDGSKTAQIMAARNLQKESTIWPCFCDGSSASSSSDGPPPLLAPALLQFSTGIWAPEANKIRLPRPGPGSDPARSGPTRSQDRPAQVVTRLPLLAPVFGQLSTGLWTPEGVAKYVCLTPAEQLDGRGRLSSRASWESENSIAAFL